MALLVQGRRTSEVALIYFLLCPAQLVLFSSFNLHTLPSSFPKIHTRYRSRPCIPLDSSSSSIGRSVGTRFLQIIGIAEVQRSCFEREGGAEGIDFPARWELIRSLETGITMSLERALDKRVRGPPPRAVETVGTKGTTGVRKAEYERTYSSRRLFAAGSGYLSLKWLYLLIGLTASLLILPLVLPPLPPPPFVLLLLPICILACLMLLAFIPL